MNFFIFSSVLFILLPGEKWNFDFKNPFFLIMILSHCVLSNHLCWWFENQAIHPAKCKGNDVIRKTSETRGNKAFNTWWKWSFQASAGNFQKGRIIKRLRLLIIFLHEKVYHVHIFSFLSGVRSNERTFQ